MRIVTAVAALLLSAGIAGAHEGGKHSGGIQVLANKVVATDFDIDHAKVSTEAFDDIGVVGNASFDGVTAGLRVNASVHAPLLCRLPLAI